MVVDIARRKSVNTKTIGFVNGVPSSAFEARTLRLDSRNTVETDWIKNEETGKAN